MDATIAPMPDAAQRRPRAFLADFGLARSLATGSRYTRTGQAIGTPAYMSPEQARADAVLAPASDVWALGCVLAEACGDGRRPFDGDAPAEVIAAVLTRRPVLGPQLPAPLRRLVLACLSPRAPARPAHARALADDARRLLRGEAPRARPPRPAGARAALVAAALLVAGAAAWRATRPRVPDTLPSAPTADAQRLEVLWARRHADARGSAAALAQALDRQPASDEWRLRLGLLHWLSGDGDAARTHWARVAATAPEHGRAQLFLGLERYFHWEGPQFRSQEAAPHLHAAEAAGGAPAAIARAARVIEAGEFAAARAALAALDGWEAHLLRTHLETIDRRGDLAAALRGLDHVIAEGFPFAWVHVNRASLRLERGDLAGATADLDTAERLDPYNPRVWGLRGLLRWREGRVEEARAVLDRALALHGEYPEALCNRGLVRRKLGDEAGAMADWTAALHLAPGLRAARVHRAEGAIRAGRLDLAEQDVRELLTHDPDAIAHKVAGDLAHTRGDNAGALRAYELALDLDRDVLDGLYNYGVVLMKLGRFADAVPPLREYVARHGDQRQGYRALAVALADSGDFAAALPVFEQALARARPGDDSADLRDAIARLHRMLGRGE